MLFILLLLILFMLMILFLRKKRKIISLFTIFIFIFILFIVHIFKFGKLDLTVLANYLLNEEVNEEVWSVVKIKDSVLIDAPVIEQLPELPRGCEVTSLAMLLEHAGVKADKMELAKEIKKDQTPFKYENGKVYFGNPYDGFVGDMYSYDHPGLGVYHGPVRELAEQYLPGKILDLTGAEFDVLKTALSSGHPVWVIINTAYKKLPEDYFQTWHTPSGTIQITYKEHSVLVTGYDDQYIYFNDPLTGIKNKKAPVRDFKEAWEQMGSQAITYYP